MKLKKKIVGIVMCLLICVSTISITGFAADDEVIDGSRLTHESSAETTKGFFLMNPSMDPSISLYGDYLARGSVSITDKGNGVVYISGETNCLSVCNSVSVNIYLQRLVNGSWQTVASRSHTSNNTPYTSYGISLAVRKGYYYRVTGSHSVTHNGRTESTSTATDAIYID